MAIIVLAQLIYGNLTSYSPLTNSPQFLKLKSNGLNSKQAKWKKVRTSKNKFVLTLYSELRTVDNITTAFLQKWLKLLANPLIQPRCEKLFELTKNVFCVVFEKNVSWYDTDFMKIFESINIIQDCDELQRIVLHFDHKIAFSL